MGIVPGFEFSEVMSGTFDRTDGAGSGAIEFDVAVRSPSLLDHLRDNKCRMSGVVNMDGVATNARLDGEMTLAPILRRLIRYDFTFRGDDGHPYRFTGQKRIKFSRLRQSLSDLPASVTDASGREIARCMVHFNLDSDLPAFLASWKPA